MSFHTYKSALYASLPFFSETDGFSNIGNSFFSYALFGEMFSCIVFVFGHQGEGGAFYE